MIQVENRFVHAKGKHSTEIYKDLAPFIEKSGKLALRYAGYGAVRF